MITVKDILDAIGRDTLATRLGLGLKSISGAAVRNQFPASWYAVVQAECDAMGLDCPMALFAFKALPANTRPDTGEAAA